MLRPDSPVGARVNVQTISIAGALAVALVAVACGDDAGTGGSGAQPPEGGGGSVPSQGGAGGDPLGGSPPEGGGGSAPAPTRAFVYAGAVDGTIDRYELDRTTGVLSPLGEEVTGGNPSFLTAAPDHLHLYAANEQGSEIIAFSIEPASGDLTELNRKSSEGAGPAHVSVDRSGRWVFAANYSGGTVAVLPILRDGSLGDAVDTESPGENPHLALIDRDNAFLYVPCLGSDLVAGFAFDDDTGQLTELEPTPVDGGTGPRHLDFHPTLDVVYVIGELGDTLTTFTQAADGSLTEIDSVSTLPVGADADSNYCADLHVHPGGATIYGSNRGHDSIAVFTIDGASGVPSPAGHTPTGGSWPRNFGIDPEGEVLLVANQNTDDIVTFSIRANGALSELENLPTDAAVSWVGVVTQPR